jgi:uncharacterized protein (TIGR03437 family)
LQAQFTLSSTSGTIGVVGVAETGGFIRPSLTYPTFIVAFTVNVNGPTQVTLNINPALLHQGVNSAVIGLYVGQTNVGSMMIEADCFPTTTLLAASPLQISVAAGGAPFSALLTQEISGNVQGGNTPISFTMIPDSGLASVKWVLSASVQGYPVNSGSVSATGTTDLTVGIDPSGLAAQADPYIGFVHIIDTNKAQGVSGADLTIQLLVTPSALPAIVANGVKNAASGITTVSPGSWASIYGSNLAPDTVAGGRVWAAGDFIGTKLPVVLDNVRVTVGGQPAAISFLVNSPNPQINFQVPDVLSGSAQVVVTTSKGSAVAATVNIQTIAPGLFGLPGTSYPVGQHLDLSLVGRGAGFTPARAGETIILYGTGFGPTVNPVIPAGVLVAAPERIAATVNARVNGVPAKKVDAFLIQAGLVQLNVTLPDGIAAGDQALSIDVGGVPLQQSNLLLAFQ